VRPEPSQDCKTADGGRSQCPHTSQNLTLERCYGALVDILDAQFGAADKLEALG
jgi:hypothetical protein